VAWLGCLFAVPFFWTFHVALILRKKKGGQIRLKWFKRIALKVRSIARRVPLRAHALYDVITFW